MGGDSGPEGRGFESTHRILDGYFFTYIWCKNCNICLKDENKWKRGRDLSNVISMHRDNWKVEQSSWAVVVTQLVGRSPLIPEVCGLNLAISEFLYRTFNYCQLNWNDKNKEIRGGNGPFKRNLFRAQTDFFFSLRLHAFVTLWCGDSWDQNINPR